MEADGTKTIDLGTHTIFVGNVIAGEILSKGTPLTYQYYPSVLKGKSSPKAPTFMSKN